MKTSSKFLLLFLVALSLRLLNLSKFSLWLDEFTSIEVATKSLTDILNGKGFDAHTPPFYYILLHYYFALTTFIGFSISESGLRFPSVIFDLASLFLLFRLTRKLIDEQVALIATGIYALLEFPIYFAQEGRMYSLLAMECLLVLNLLLPLVELTIVKAALLAIVTACGLYTHYYFAFFTLGVGIALLFDFRTPGFKKAFIAFFVGGLSFLPWIGVVLKLAASGGQVFREFSLLSVPYSVFRFLAGYSVFPLDSITKMNQMAALKANILIVVPYGLLSALLLFLGLISIRKAKSFQYLVIPLVTSTVIPLIISIKTPMFSERYLSGIVPLVCILFALALDSLIGSTKKMAVSVTALCIFYSLICHYGGEPRFAKEQWKEVSNTLRVENVTSHVYVSPDFIKPILGFYCPECFISDVASIPTEQLEKGSAIVFRGKPEFRYGRTSTTATFPAESGLHVQIFRD